jgi:hypothetical protein
MSDQTKPAEAGITRGKETPPRRAAKLAAKPRCEIATPEMARAEYIEALARNPSFKVRSGTGTGFIVGMPGGMPPKPDRP